MKYCLCFLLVTCITFPAFGRIGETPAECQARYGEPIKVEKEKNQLIFRKGTMLIVAGFFEGKCDHLGFRKAEEDILGNPEELSENEIAVLCEANGNGQKWSKKPMMSLTQLFQTEDGLVSAQYEPLKRFLMIFTRECNERLQAEIKATEAKKLDGF